MGTFIINGTERVIVNAACIVPLGIFFDHDSREKPMPAAKLLYSCSNYSLARLLDRFRVSIHKDRLYVRIDRRRKTAGHGIPARHIGFSSEPEILNYFYETDKPFNING